MLPTGAGGMFGAWEDPTVSPQSQTMMQGDGKGVEGDRGPRVGTHPFPTSWSPSVGC